ncbi:TetR/AcrR family transcriptional regulator [Dactylosporangium sp. NPDC049140]|uniref:TetR/AcrR family transcriptional regulator n=1 Tax=Dactylosporangium sp. NPDC049140 TaxID=3155647 RepID=UPI003402BD71
MGRPKQFDPDVAVNKAMELFWRKGFAETTPQDLVTELDIGKGSLYNTFASKRALFDLALRRYVEMRVAGVVETLERPGPVTERLRVALRRLADADVTLTSRGCLGVNTAVELAGQDEAAAEVVGRLFDRIEAAFRAVIEEGQRSGEIAAGRDSQQLAGLILASFIGMSVLAKTADAQRLRRTIDAVMAVL